MAELAEVATEEVETQEPVADEAVEPTVEDIARKAGWSPKDEWRGDPKDWKPAPVFLTETATSSRDIRREMREMKKQMEATGKTTAKMAEDFRRRTIAEAEARIRELTEANDPEGVIEAAQDLAKAKAVDPERDLVADFQARNTWYGEHEEASALAAGITHLRAQKGASVAEQLKAAEDAVKKKYPELFDDAPAQSAARPSPPALAGGSRSATPNREPGYSDLPASAQTAFKTLVSTGLAEDTAEGRKQYATTWLKFNGKKS